MRGGVSDERPVRDCGASVLLVILEHPRSPVDNRLDRTAELAALHHLHVDDLGLGRDTESLSGDRPGHSGPMRIAHLRVAGERVESFAHAPLKLRVCAEHAAVEDVDRHAVSRAGATVGLVERQSPLVDAIERQRDRLRLEHAARSGPDIGEERSG